MSLSELIDIAIEAHQRYGDLNVVILDGDEHRFFNMVQLDAIIAEVKLPKTTSPQTVFAFAPVAKTNNDMQ